MNIPESVPNDTRTSGELAEDWADLELVDFYREWGLLEVPADKEYSGKFVLGTIRAAFAHGLRKGSAEPEATREYLEAYSAEKRRCPDPVLFNFADDSSNY